MANPRNKKNLVSFNAGELSPKLDARVDTEKYAAGCRQCQNMIPMPHGGVTRRKGFEFIASAKFGPQEQAAPCKLIDFQFSRDVAFMLELGELYMRFFYLGQPIMDGMVPYEIETPFTAAECAALQYVQINDVVYLTHPAHPVQKLSRLANDSWTIEAVDFDRPPFLDENITATTITASATSGTGITLTASTAIFNAGNVGGYFEIGHRRQATSVNKTITSTGTSASILVLGKAFFRTTGIWTATVTVERSEDGATDWEAVRTYTGTNDRNIDVEIDEEDQAYYRINVTSWTSGSSSPNAIFEVADAFVRGVVQITAVASGTSATADVKRPLFATTATKYWSEGAWSIRRGFPAACAFFENRMFFAGSTFQPQTLWGSIVDDYEDFTKGTADDDSVAFTLSSTERQQVLWMVSQSRLVIGTTSGEWTASGGDLDISITPTKIKVRQQSNFGSQQGRALLVNDTILFVQRSGRKLREAVYDSIREGYQSNDVTILSDHITAGGITSPCYQSDRDSIFWAIANGNLIGMTYEKEQSVIAWHRHKTIGVIESVETIYGTLDDEVWISVIRVIGGVKKRFIERMTGYYNPSVDVYKVLNEYGPWSSVSANVLSYNDATFAPDVVNPVGTVGGVTVTACPVFNGQTIEILGPSYPELTGSPSSPLSIGTFPDYFTITGTLIPASPPLTTQALYGDQTGEGGIGPTCLHFSEDVAAVSIKTYSNQVARVWFEAYRRDGSRIEFFNAAGGSIGFRQYTTADGIQNFTLYSRAVDIAGIAVSNGSVSGGAPCIVSLDFLTSSQVQGATYEETGIPSSFSGRDTEKTFVDSCLVYVGIPTTTVDGLDHLEGETVDILADGAVHPSRVVTGGQVVLEYAAGVVHVGLPYDSIIQPMRLDMDDVAGNTQGAVKQIRGVTLRLMDTLGLKVSDILTDAENAVFRELEFRTTEDNMDSAPPIFTGEKYHEVESEFDNDATIVLKQDQPLPWTLLG